ncbi:MAG: lasso peptide biosynthesis B2 protein [Rivularia sp. ALOHA_DT_140]|nr:lasso peptide biosynthesis B2 protein [Rivularia sp. ALOHA_DT_140]
MNWLKLVIRKFIRIWQLDGNSKWLLLQAFVLLPIVAISLKFRGLKRTQAGLVRLLPPAKKPVENNERYRKIVNTVQMVRLAVRYCQPWANCLKKSLVLWILLRHQGIECELRIGVQREAIKFEAHAWVECEGFVLNDTPDVRERYAMFERPIEFS